MFAMQCDPTEFLIARGCWIINQVFCNFVVCVGLGNLISFTLHVMDYCPFLAFHKTNSVILCYLFVMLHGLLEYYGSIYSLRQLADFVYT